MKRITEILKDGGVPGGRIPATHFRSCEEIALWIAAGAPAIRAGMSVYGLLQFDPELIHAGDERQQILLAQRIYATPAAIERHLIDADDSYSPDMEG